MRPPLAILTFFAAVLTFSLGPIVRAVDTDGDGMDDDWELTYFESLEACEPYEDSDYDGLSNLQEYNRQTDPTKYVLALSQGWNDVSIARAPVDNSVEGIFGDHVLATVWYWNGSKYKTTNEMLPLRGHWVYFVAQDDVEIEVSGFVPVQDVMALISGGSFEMGDSFGDGPLPVHTVSVSSFYMSACEVTNEQMREVMQWAYDNGRVTASSSTVQNAQRSAQELLSLDSDACQLGFLDGTFSVDAGKGAYPCVVVSWYGAVAYCNYRSEKEGMTPCYDLSDWSCDWDANGYRLPTEAEWEYAARGGLAGKRFPWGDTITHDQANYYSSSSDSYDVSPTRGHHPDYDDAGEPYTSPVGSFSDNDYGLYDMAGNVWEWCWDWYGNYSSAAQTDPVGPASGFPSFNRVLRGGSWFDFAAGCCCAARSGTGSPGSCSIVVGFRVVKGVSGGRQ